MPEISDLILTIVKPLIVHDDKMSIEIKGKQGRVARAIRTIVYSVRTKGTKRVRLVIEGAE